MARRRTIPPRLRTQILLTNQHACCICGKPGTHIHHINGDPTDNKSDNLAVLCLPHHDEATKPSGLSARITSEQIRRYKKAWEQACQERIRKGARACTAFFMVDYKNAERIRQLFVQLSASECQQAYHILIRELKEESTLRQAQKFDVSLEPTLMWSTVVERLLESIRLREVRPSVFQGMQGHPKDPLLPVGPPFSDPNKAYYDIWCQLMIRAIIAVRMPYLLKDLLSLQEPSDSGLLAGSLVAFEANLHGSVAPPGKHQEIPVSKTTLTLSNESATISTELQLKTHYVYSETAASSLEGGRSSGLLFLRSINSFKDVEGKKIISFSSTPLIIGCGGGGLLKIP